MTGGIGYFHCVENWVRDFEEKKDEIIAGLKRVIKSMLTVENMTISYTADADGFALLPEALKKLTAALPQGDGVIHPFEAPKANKNEGFTSSSKVN